MGATRLATALTFTARGKKSRDGHYYFRYGHKDALMATPPRVMNKNGDNMATEHSLMAPTMLPQLSLMLWAL